MKRRLILHLGLSRTGTTSIQGFFRRNPDTLAAAGILYPKVGAGIPSHPSFERTALTTHLDEETNHVALALEIHRRDHDADVASVETPLWAAAFAQIEASGAHTAIISFENFSVQVGKYRFDVLTPRLRDFDVLGMVYLRRQEDWAPSLYGHKVLGRQRFAVSFSDYITSLGRRLQYSTILDTIRNHIPLDRLAVGNFDQARSGLLEDFLDRAGLPRDQLLSAGERSVRNASFPPWAILFLLRCNQAGLSDEAFLQVRRALGFQAAGKKKLALGPGLDLATPAERAALRKATADDADRLAERYGVVLGGETSEPMTYRPFDESDFRAIRAAIAPRVTRQTQDALDTL